MGYKFRRKSRVRWVHFLFYVFLFLYSFNDVSMVDIYGYSLFTLKHILLYTIVLVLLVNTSFGLSPPLGGLSYYNFANVTDIWNLHNATNNGAISITNYPIFNISGNSGPNSYNYNNSDSVSLGTSNDYEFLNTDNFSISVWVNTTQTGFNRLFHRGLSSAPYTGLFFGQHILSGVLYVELYGTLGNNIGRRTSDAINTGIWTHLVVTYNGNNDNSGFKLYIDAIRKDDTNSGIGMTGDGSVVATSYIGHDSLGESWNGSIDEFQIFNKTLTQNEIQNIFNYGVLNATSPIIINNDLILTDRNLIKIPIEDINESVKFFIFNNYTRNSITTPYASCNTTMNNISTHYTLNNISNHTLSLSTDIISLIDTHEKTNFLSDFVEFRICRENIKVPIQILSDNIQIKEIDKNIIPLCGVGFHNEKNVYTLNNFSDTFNLSVRCLGCNGGNRKITLLTDDNLNVLHFEREQSLKILNLTYNITSELYEFRKHYHEYSNIGLRNINITCNGTTTLNSFTINDVLLSIDIVSIDDIAYSDGINVESSGATNITLEIGGDIISLIEFNISYSNGTTIKTVNIESMTLSNTDLNIDGIYNISILAIDNDNNSTFKTGYFIINDTIFPTITWSTPSNTNNTIFLLNQETQLNILLSDVNLFAYEILIFNPGLVLMYNFSATNLEITTSNIIDIITPNVTGTWIMNITVTDDHTIKHIPKYKYKNDNENIIFNFSRYKGREYLGDDTISINYMGGMNIRNTTITKLNDRYKFAYYFFTEGRTKDVWHNYQIRCDNIIYRDKSNYVAHFVCPVTKNWIDFESDNIIDWKVRRCGKNCYNVKVLVPPNEKLEFNSLGGLNEISESVTFSVQEQIGTNTTLVINECPSTIESQMALWTIVFIMLSFILFGFVFHLKGVGIIASIGMLILSWYIVGCNNLIGYIVAGIGLVLIITFALMDT